MRHTCLGQPEKLAMAEHKFETYHNTEFCSITILDKAPGYMDNLIKEAIKIRLHPRNFNGDGGFSLSRSWYPVTNIIKQY
jgi:hypothetical protein